MEKYKSDDVKSDNRKRIITYIIVLIIIILCLLTSCSCTSRYFGRIGDLFRNEEEIIIGNEHGGKETIRNRELTFDIKKLVMSVSDKNGKIGFSYKKINPDKFTCKTSDASIATCYVSDGYVVVIPKKPGNITVTLQAETNDKIYEATAEVTITESNKYIILSNNKGTINLAYSKTKTIGYKLVGINGTVTVTSSDPSIATGYTSNGKLIITGYKKGSVTITLSVTDNGTTYKTDYTLNVINSLTNGNQNKDELLTSLTVSSGKLTPNFNPTTKNYIVNIGSDVKTITVEGTVNDGSKITYTYEGKNYDSFENIPMHEGDNVVKIIVTASDGKETTYTVTIKKDKTGEPSKPELNGDATLANITSNKGVLSPTFDKNVTDYEITVNKNVEDISLTATASSNKSSIVYSYNNKDYASFKDMPLENGSNVVFIKVTAEDGTEKIYTVTINKYYVDSEKEYEISYDSKGSSKNIILYTNMFKDNVKVTSSYDKKTLTICSASNSEICININTTSNIIESLDFVGEVTDNASLPIKILANSIGEATIHVTATANGVAIDEFDINFKVVEKYIVTLKANGGIFNEFETEFTFKISPEDSPIDLKNYDEPYFEELIDGCLMVHKFIGYAKEGDIDQNILYNLTDKNLINYSDLDGDITLVAIYDMENATKKESESKTLWLVDVPVFRDKEYFEKYNKEKPIYPGATGEYTMQFINESNDTLIITGMILKEDTICFTNGSINGCLNMGYIIKDSANNFHYGKSNTYDILNNTAAIKDWANNHNETTITFDPSTNANTTIGPKGSINDELEITIHWKWVEIDDNSDKLDTLIGNQAAAKLQDESINDLYTLFVGINFDVLIDACN